MKLLDSGIRVLTLVQGTGARWLKEELSSLSVKIPLTEGCLEEMVRDADGAAWQAVAAAAVCVGVIKYVLHEPAASTESVLWAAAVLAGFSGAGLVASLLVPVTRFTPLVRMIAEWLEIVAIIAALPLAAWIGGLFNWVRMR